MIITKNKKFWTVFIIYCLIFCDAGNIFALAPQSQARSVAPILKEKEYIPPRERPGVTLPRSPRLSWKLSEEEKYQELREWRKKKRKEALKKLKENQLLREEYERRRSLRRERKERQTLSRQEQRMQDEKKKKLEKNKQEEAQRKFDKEHHLMYMDAIARRDEEIEQRRQRGRDFIEKQRAKVRSVSSMSVRRPTTSPSSLSTRRVSLGPKPLAWGQSLKKLELEVVGVSPSRLSRRDLASLVVPAGNWPFYISDEIKDLAVDINRVPDKGFFRAKDILNAVKAVHDFQKMSYKLKFSKDLNNGFENDLNSNVIYMHWGLLRFLDGMLDFQIGPDIFDFVDNRLRHEYYEIVRKPKLGKLKQNNIEAWILNEVNADIFSFSEKELSYMENTADILGKWILGSKSSLSEDIFNKNNNLVEVYKKIISYLKENKMEKFPFIKLSGDKTPLDQLSETYPKIGELLEQGYRILTSA